MTDQPVIDEQTALWREQIAAKPIKSCGRLDMHTYLPSPARVGRVKSDVVRYVYFEDGSECIVLGQLADCVAFRAADYGAVVAERDAARAENEGLRGLLVAAKDSQLAEREAASAELAAVMQLAVDKWLDDEEGNPATRAARAREVGLKAIEAAEAELAAVKRQRDELARASLELAGAADQVCPTFDARGEASKKWARTLAPLIQGVRLLAAEQPKPADITLPAYGIDHTGKAVKLVEAEQQKPLFEPRPWWVVFGLERHAASRMVASAPKSGQLLVDMSLRHLADEAGKRGVHPAEIARALDEARAELQQPKPEVQP